MSRMDWMQRYMTGFCARHVRTRYKLFLAEKDLQVLNRIMKRYLIEIAFCQKEENSWRFYWGFLNEWTFLSNLLINSFVIDMQGFKRSTIVGCLQEQRIEWRNGRIQDCGKTARRLGNQMEELKGSASFKNGYSKIFI